jgi:hypothetical protein
MLEARSQAQRGTEKIRTLCRIAELYEDRLQDPAEAIRRYQQILELGLAGAPGMALQLPEVGVPR